MTAPQKFTKRPVTIEAMQFDGSVASADAIKAWAIMPDGMTAETGRDYNAAICTYLGIRTLEGTMRASPGDWIIRGVKGEFYPCKPDIFEQTYTAGQPAAAGELPEAVDFDRMRGGLHPAFHADLEKLRAAVAGYRRDAENAVRRLYRGYVNSMESARDRIVGLGGTCDPLDVMELSDPYLQRARDDIAILANPGSGEVQS